MAMFHIVTGGFERPEDLPDVQVALRQDGAAQEAARAGAEPVAAAIEERGIARVAFADIEIFEVHHGGAPGQPLAGNRRILIHAHDVSGIQQQAVIGGMHAVQDALHAVHAVAEEAVVFDHGHHAALFAICAYALRAFDDDGEPALKILKGIFTVRAAEGANVVPHAGQPQFRSDVHMHAQPLDFPLEILAGFAQIGQHGIIHKFHTRVFRAAYRFANALVIDHAIFFKLVGKGHEFRAVSAVGGNPIQHFAQRHAAAGNFTIQGVSGKANFHGINSSCSFVSCWNYIMNALGMQAKFC